ncbi:MAG: hypothetical protein ACRDL8_02105 [Solirubrobacteraceae bacterium]
MATNHALIEAKPDLHGRQRHDPKPAYEPPDPQRSRPDNGPIVDHHPAATRSDCLTAVRPARTKLSSGISTGS